MKSAEEMTDEELFRTCAEGMPAATELIELLLRAKVFECLVCESNSVGIASKAWKYCPNCGSTTLSYIGSL